MGTWKPKTDGTALATAVAKANAPVRLPDVAPLEQTATPSARLIVMPDKLPDPPKSRAVPSQDKRVPKFVTVDGEPYYE